MPELREGVAFHIFVEDHIAEQKAANADMTVKNLWADAAEAVPKKDVDAAKAAGKEKPVNPEVALAPDGCPYVLQNDSWVKRGNVSTQKPLFPPPLARTDDNPNPPRIQDYALVGSEPNNRAMILKFERKIQDGDKDEGGPRTLYLRLAYLTHTCVQIYSKTDWAHIIKTPKHSTEDGSSARGKIGLAIEMKKHTLAFVSNDQLFEPVWVERKEDLPKTSYVSVYDDFRLFLRRVIDWIRKRYNASGRWTRLARIAIREAQDVFFGVGVYTVNELFFMAGLPPTITEAELVDCPSRLARFCEALWTFAYISHTKLRKLMGPAIVNGVLAPKDAHRRKYIQWLHVHARSTCRMTPRMVVLLDEFVALLNDRGKQPTDWCRSEEENLYDVFDPYFIRHSLNPPAGSDKQQLVLGHLIFGQEEWRHLTMANAGAASSAPDDPLTEYYMDRGMLDSPTLLKPGHYTEGGVTAAGIIVSRAGFLFKHVYYYRVDKGKAIWSGVPVYPPNCAIDKDQGGELYFDPTAHRTVQEIVGSKRRAKLFATIITMPKQVAIGPLEYSATATQIRTTHGERRQVTFPTRGASWKTVREFASSKEYLASQAADNSDDNSDDDDSDDGDVESTGDEEEEEGDNGDHDDGDYEGDDDEAEDGDYDDDDDEEGDGEDEEDEGALSRVPSEPPLTSDPGSELDFGTSEWDSDAESDRPPKRVRRYTNSDDAALAEARDMLGDVEGQARDALQEGGSRRRSGRDTGPRPQYRFTPRGLPGPPLTLKPKRKRTTGV